MPTCLLAKDSMASIEGFLIARPVAQGKCEGMHLAELAVCAPVLRNLTYPNGDRSEVVF